MSNPDLRFKCPDCGSLKAILIVYGYPGEELLAAACRGEVHLGGNSDSQDDPLLHCTDCGKDFFSSQLLERTLNVKR